MAGAGKGCGDFPPVWQRRLTIVLPFFASPQLEDLRQPYPPPGIGCFSRALHIFFVLLRFSSCTLYSNLVYFGYIMALPGIGAF